VKETSKDCKKNSHHRELEEYQGNK